jgi:hypothetical protein
MVLWLLCSSNGVSWTVFFVSRVAQSVQCLATGWTRFDPRQRRKDFSSNPGVGNLFMLEGGINLAVIKQGRIQETSIRYT